MSRLKETTERFDLVANVSLMFKEVPLNERFAAAAEAGFGSVELWWPFASATPSGEEVDDLVDAIALAGVDLTGLNLFAGDMGSGERGIVSRLDRTEEFAANLEVVADIALRTGCSAFNALYGQRQRGQSEVDQDALAIENLSLAARRLGPLGGTVLIEPLSRGLNGAYPIETAADAVAVVEKVRQATGLENIGLLFDTFHLSNNGEDLLAGLERYGEQVAHVQLADSPGRGQPGSGSIRFDTVLEGLQRAGYGGVIACEYAPTGETVDSLDWVGDHPVLRLG